MLPTIERQGLTLNQHEELETHGQQPARQRLADTLGLELTYESIWGSAAEVLPEAANAIAAALTGESLNLANSSQIEDYLARQSALSDSLLCPQQTLVESVDKALGRLRLNLTAQEEANPVLLTVNWENGSISCLALGSPKWLLLASSGYHQARVHTIERTATFEWILSPGSCYFPKVTDPLNGINCFLPSIRSDRNWGCGDLTDLTQLAGLLRSHAPVDFIALNPLHAIHNRVPYNTSPYLPLSIFTHNLIYLDIERVPEFKSCTLAQRVAEWHSFQARLSTLRQGHLVDYEAVARIKKFFLLLLYREFLKQGGRTQATPWITNYCMYRAFDDYFHRRDANCWHWHHWPAPYQSPDSPESLMLRDRLARHIDFYAYVEMRITDQLGQAQQSLLDQGYSIGLYHDLALATDRVGADYWAYQNLFAPGVRVGSPPDDFNVNGQDWGFPALHPQRQANAGFRYFIESIRCAAVHGGAVRFDHVMRLARLYWIPDGMSASEGAYVRDRFDDLLHVLALESQRGHFLVVGEDLGTVPSYFRQALTDFNILSYKLVLFERDGSRFRDAKDYPEQAIASFTTHDLPTFDGWHHGADLRARRDAGLLDPSDLESSYEARRRDIDHLSAAFSQGAKKMDHDTQFEALCLFLASTSCRMRLLNLEELSAEHEQQNLPGTTSEYPNWRRRFPVALEALSQDAAILGRLGLWATSLKDSPK